MSPRRHALRMLLTAAAGARLLGALTAVTASPRASAQASVANPDAVRAGRVLAFPRDHGAHLPQRTEWWYVTGWLGTPEHPRFGVQITFFRSRTGVAQDNPSRFAARQLLFAHAAVLSLDGGTPQHRHAQRIERWTGAPQAPSHAAIDRGDVRLGAWTLADDGHAWRTGADGGDFSFDLSFARTQPLLLQGDAGYSRKGPEATQASHYYSEPQLAASGHIVLNGRRSELPQGRAWMDHEWSDELLHPEAVGWDWIGMNLFDGSALTAFVLRRRDGSAVFAGGSFRAAGGAARPFAAAEVRFTAGQRWRSPATAASYPVQWHVDTPAGRWTVRALHEAQELDSRASTGSVYWEGLSELLDAQGRRVGLGYLEMTGYASALKLGDAGRGLPIITA